MDPVRTDRDRTDIGEYEERGRSVGRGRSACQRDSRDWRALRPPGTGWYCPRGSLAFFSNDIHNGADDNASGTAMVVEMARRLGARRDPLPRRVVFMAFSGEERGLLGSQYYVEHPVFPLKSTVMMVKLRHGWAG